MIRRRNKGDIGILLVVCYNKTNFDLEDISMKEVKDLKEKLKTERPVSWGQFPDIDLYMDQVLTYMKRQHVLGEGEQLTSAMINNYIKNGLLPRATSKKYNREHLAYLTAICLLKQVLSVNSTGLLLKEELVNVPIREFYEKYCATLDQAFLETSDKIQEDASVEELTDLALQFAVSSYAEKLACERLTAIIQEKIKEQSAKQKKEQLELQKKER